MAKSRFPPCNSSSLTENAAPAAQLTGQNVRGNLQLKLKEAAQFMLRRVLQRRAITITITYYLVTAAELWNYVGATATRDNKRIATVKGRSALPDSPNIPLVPRAQGVLP